MLSLFRLLSRLPLGMARALGALAGALVFLASPAYRRKLRANLGRAGFPGPRFALRAAAEAGRMVGELPFVWFRSTAEVMARVHCDDLAVYRRVEALGRGVIFLTPHLGAFEVTARHYATRAPLTVLFKPPKQQSLGRLLSAARALPGMSAEPANTRGLRSLLRALRRGEAVGLLPDQVPTDGDGRWTPFFGAPAYTMTLPQRLAQTTGASVVMVIGERLPGGAGWRVHVHEIEGEPTPELINQTMERWIRRLPTQYLWSYNRYKRPGGAPTNA